jgi:hypothetical protein
MASVAICPHCYLQLAIPDGVSRDAEVECPSCHTEFGLDKATVRAIPQGVVKDAGKNTLANAAKESLTPGAADDQAPHLSAGTGEAVFSSEAQEVELAGDVSRDVIPLDTRNLGDDVPATEVSAEDADAEIAAWFRSNKTVPDVVPMVVTGEQSSDELTDKSDLDESELEDDAVTNAEDPTPMDEPQSATVDADVDDADVESTLVRPSAVTLADWQSLRVDNSVVAKDMSSDDISGSTGSADTQPRPADEIETEFLAVDAGVPGPSFDLPDVPLTLNTGGTVEFSSEEFKSAAAGADFELDDVEFDSSDDRWMKDEFKPADEPLEASAKLPHDPTAETLVDNGDFDQELGETSYEEPLYGAATQPSDRGYDDPTNPAADHEDVARDLPASLPPQRRGRKRSALRTMVGAVAAAPFGLAIGYFALLWLKGPSADFLQVAMYVPQKFLPASFVSTPLREENAVAPPPETVAETTPEPAVTNSGNIPASFETPARPLVNDMAAGNENRDAALSPAERAKLASSETVTPATNEPRRFAAPNAASLAGEDAQIVGAPLFTVAEFATTLAQAQKAQSGLVTGDLSDPAVRREKGMSYAKLCDLAQIVTFCDDASAGDRLNELRRDAEEVFKTILTTPHAQAEVAQIAAIWIGSPHRQHGGVFLAGTIHGGEIAGDTYEYQLSTEAGGDLKLLLPRPLDTHVAAAGHPVGIVGSIVDNPTSKISGYTGSSAHVIWVHDVISLDQ